MRYTQGPAITPRKGFRPAAQRPAVDVYLQRGAEMQARGQLDDAAREYRAAIRRFPQTAAGYSNLGTVFQAQGKIKDAIHYFERALALDPDDGRLHLNLAAGWKSKNRPREALPHYRSAVERLANKIHDAHPDRITAEMSLAETLLTLGEFEEGWKRYEWRHRLPFLAPTYSGIMHPMWTGEPLDGRHIVVLAEQGLGDSLQFFRYLPRLRERAGRVTVIVPTALRALAGEMSGIEVVSCSHFSLSYDVYCPLMSLPRLFGTTVETIPATAPYLSLPWIEREKAAALSWPDDQMRVGLVWAGNAVNPNDGVRSLPFGCIEPLLRLDRVRFYSFQLGREEDNLTARTWGVHALQLEANNLAYTGALLSQMDLVISVDTALAHLAGGLGIPTWLLLPFMSDWRWLHDREDTPWYPTLRLFRQKEPGGWNGVMEAVQNALMVMTLPNADSVPEHNQEEKA